MVVHSDRVRIHRACNTSDMTHMPQRTGRDKHEEVDQSITTSDAVRAGWVWFLPRGNLVKAHVRQGSDFARAAERAGDKNVKLLLVASIRDVERVVDRRFLPIRGRGLLDRFQDGRHNGV